MLGMSLDQFLDLKKKKKAIKTLGGRVDIDIILDDVIP